MPVFHLLQKFQNTVMLRLYALVIGAPLGETTRNGLVNKLGKADGQDGLGAGCSG